MTEQVTGGGNRTRATGRTEMENHYKGFWRILMRKVTSSHVFKGFFRTQMKEEERQNQEPGEEATALI